MSAGAPPPPGSWADLLQTSQLPRLDARALLAHVSGQRREWLLAHEDEPAPEAIAATFHALAERRRRGEPLAYLVGHREFYGRPFTVTPAVLIPRPETELLVEAALARLPASGAAVRVLDLGTGSGAIAVSLALARPDATVWATDLSPAALAVAQHNAHALGASNIHWLMGDWWQALPTHAAAFDCVVANPPYIATHDGHLQTPALQHEPRAALASGQDGLDALQRIIGNAPPWLRTGGWLMLEHGFAQGPAVRAALNNPAWQDVETLVDLPGHERVTVARRAKP
jgi:release factor glutamine methyltransferase